MALYVVRAVQRDKLQEHLTKCGMGTGIHYPIPVHLQKPYLDMGFSRGDFPVSENAAVQVLSLPMCPELSSEQQDQVIDEIAKFEATTETRYPVQSTASA